MSTVDKAEGNRLKLTYGIFVINIKGKNTNILTGKTGSIVETPSQQGVSELQTVSHEWHWRSRSACEQGRGLSDPPDVVLISSATI